MSNMHIPVLLHEAVEGLDIKDQGIYIDMTLGRGGHSEQILLQLKGTGKLYCFDRDEEAITYSQQHLEKVATNFKIIKTEFSHLKAIIANEGITHIDGILFDLGVSSCQFDDEKRGFSYRYDSELDMRMNQDDKISARDIINSYSLNELSRIFRDYGEESFAYPIAKAVIKAREKKEIVTTFELVEIIKSVLPNKVLQKPKHPAKKIFQAIRIEVNHEFSEIETALKDALFSISCGGRIAVITFNSLEDRIVKNIFKEVSTTPATPRNAPPSNVIVEFKEINSKVILPTEEEIETNKRAKPAKLRIIERIKDHERKS